MYITSNFFDGQPVTYSSLLDFATMPVQGHCARDLITFCVFIKENQCVSVCIPLSKQAVMENMDLTYTPGRRLQTISHRETHTHIHYRALMMLFFTLCVHLWQSNMSNKSTAQEANVALAFTHSVLYTHMHRIQTILSPLNLTLPHTHSYTQTHLHDGAWQRAIDCVYLAWQTIHNFSLRET